MKKLIFTYFIFSICFHYSILAEEKGAIYSKSYPASLDINFGPCFVGDTLYSDFILENYTNNTISLPATKPSFAIEISPLQLIVDEFRSFTLNTVLPLTIPSLSKSQINIKQFADPNLGIFPTGWYHANLQIGFMDKADTLLHKIFSLRAKKTLKYIDGYEDTLRFDSAYVNPPEAQTLSWRVKSTRQDSITISSQKFILISQQITPAELSAEIFQVNPTFRKKYDEMNWQISYRPFNIGADTGLVELAYKPLPLQYPDSIQKAALIAIGLGVKQELRLVGVNGDFTINGDTIFVGNQVTQKPFRVTAQVKNAGNLPFGSISETMESELYKFNYTNITNLALSRHLQPGLTEGFAVDITPQELGTFVYKYKLESDIFDKTRRKILYPANDAKFKTIYIVGKAVEPVLQVRSDTIDFGVTYLYQPFCESSKDTVIVLRNAGNDTLRISKIEITNQYPLFSFTCDYPEFVIPPMESRNIIISFSPALAQNYNANLVIHNNSFKSEYSLKLIGNTLYPPIASIGIDTIFGKPGSIVKIPIKVDSSIVFANEFTDTLFYDRSLLHYVGYSIENTATTQPLEPIVVKEFPDGKLYIHIKKYPKTRFTLNNILINLQFKVFLGKAISTEISFMNPHFSNEICYEGLNLPSSNIRNGTFVTDSICGINLKAFPAAVPIIGIYPNPGKGAVNVAFDCLEETSLSFELFDSFGKTLYRKDFQKYNIGKYEEYFDFSQLNYGIYYLKVTDTNSRIITQKIIVLK